MPGPNAATSASNLNAAPSSRALSAAARRGGDRPALVAHVLAAGQRELDLHAPVLEVEPRRHEREPLLAHLPVEAVDLTAVQQQLARPGRLVVRPVPLV